MGRRKEEKLELRYYELQPDQYAMTLLGESWIREYGEGIGHLHFHNLMEIGYCRFGDGELVLGEESCRYEKDTFSIIPQNYPHTTNSTPCTKSYWEYIFLDVEKMIRHIYPDNPVMEDKLMRRVNKTAILKSAQSNETIALLIKEIMEQDRKKEEFYKVVIEGMLQALVLEIAKMNAEDVQKLEAKRQEGINRISPALNYMKESYKENIKIENLAEICHMSETHFRRLFEAYVNMTPVEYLNLVRVQRACEYMKKSNASMDEVAIKAGFSTTSTFNRNFKQIVGKSPYQWKKNMDDYDGKLLNFHISALKGW